MFADAVSDFPYFDSMIVTKDGADDKYLFVVVIEFNLILSITFSVCIEFILLI